MTITDINTSNKVTAICKILVQDFNDLSRYIIRKDVDTITVDTRSIAKIMIESGLVDGDLNVINSIVCDALWSLSTAPAFSTRAELRIKKPEQDSGVRRYCRIYSGNVVRYCFNVFE